MQNQYQNIINHIYTAFNNRDIDAVISLMHPDVRWPNGWEGGYVNGPEEVSAYWTRQWKEINPEVTPVSIEHRKDGKIEVEVHQIVKNLEGKELFNGNIKHVYSFTDGLIQSMEIEKS